MNTTSSENSKKIRSSTSVRKKIWKTSFELIKKKWLFGWEKKNFAKKKNSDLWIRFLKIYRKHNVKFIWIKGHANIKENERCDQLAVQCAENGPHLIDEEFERNSESNELF